MNLTYARWLRARPRVLTVAESLLGTVLRLDRGTNHIMVCPDYEMIFDEPLI